MLIDHISRGLSLLLTNHVQPGVTKSGFKAGGRSELGSLVILDTRSME